MALVVLMVISVCCAVLLVGYVLAQALLPYLTLAP
jgi:hypothetical protein